MRLHRLLKSIELHEGFRSQPYDDATGEELVARGKVTIGFGRNLTDRPLTRREARVLLGSDLVSAVNAAQSFAAPVWEELTNSQREVLVEMAYNLGRVGLFTFREMRSAVRRHDAREVANQMLDSRWAEQVGQRARRLAHAYQAGDDDVET